MRVFCDKGLVEALGERTPDTACSTRPLGPLADSTRHPKGVFPCTVGSSKLEANEATANCSSSLAPAVLTDVRMASSNLLVNAGEGTIIENPFARVWLK